MSRQIFRDVEEGLSREVRRITFFNQRTKSRLVLPDTFDPFTGEVIHTNIEPDFYDTSSNANFIQYPNFFVKLLKTREDRFTGRVEPPYGKYEQTPVVTAPKAYEIVLRSADGTISASGNTIDTSNFQIRKIQPGYYIRTLLGNNIGTYIVSSVSISGSEPSVITVSNVLLNNLPALYFNTDNRFNNPPRDVYFSSVVDLNTIKVGDNFIDFSNTTFAITAIDLYANKITLGGTATPNLASGAQITRSGNVFQNIDTNLVPFIVMNPEIPIMGLPDYNGNTTSGVIGLSPRIPIDAYYLIRIDSKERQTHIDVLNRVWEEFNPPRTGLPVIIRSKESAEDLLAVDVPTGGSSTITVYDNRKFNINDTITIINKFLPTQDGSHGWSGQFVTKVVGLVSTNQLVLADVVPDTFKICDETLIVSNAYMDILMFHFVDHATKDTEASQYWVHEFTFWVQIWVDRLEDPSIYDGVVSHPATIIEDINGNVIINDI